MLLYVKFGKNLLMTCTAYIKVMAFKNLDRSLLIRYKLTYMFVQILAYEPVAQASWSLGQTKEQRKTHKNYEDANKFLSFLNKLFEAEDTKCFKKLFTCHVLDKKFQAKTISLK